MVTDCGWCKHAAPTTHVAQSSPARMMCPTAWNPRTPSHSSARTPRLRTGLVTCPSADCIRLSIVFVQVGVNKVHSIWWNGRLEHSRQSDIFTRWSLLFGVHWHQWTSTHHGGEKKRPRSSQPGGSHRKRVMVFMKVRVCVCLCTCTCVRKASNLRQTHTYANEETVCKSFSHTFFFAKLRNSSHTEFLCNLLLSDEFVIHRKNQEWFD